MEPVSNQFPKMGKTNANAVNVSARPSANTKSVSRAGGGVSGVLEHILAPSRRHTEERLGNVGVPQTSHAPQREPSAGSTGRNVRTLPSVMRYVDPFGDYSRGF